MSFWQYFKSAAGALFGVQSEQTRQRDFQQNSIVPYLISGVVLIILLIAGLLVIVNWVID
ncbi:DUF2970 domain-containing protein [Echinimonas agarilytica]|uniref:DUF2970 domain-containing protein n=1 Tax=Echinimonas agarilytica TaxID=1215918 RepID=A0AA41W495_9GAMM|nr:DUF2970 domain-containing protein [Echinimonas agarilytica]MCM2678348.1 DUF2970 domain-containing protein [Echinimonas agarilytica]